MLAAAVLWGLIGLQSRYVLDEGVSPEEIAFWRAAVAGVLFAGHAVVTGGLRVHDRRDLAPFAGFALVGVSVFYVAYALAVDTGGVSLASILLYTSPAFVAVAAHLLLGERLTPGRGLLVLVTLTGVVLVAQGSGSGVTVSPASLTWGLVAALSYSTYYLFGKWALRRYRPVAIYALVMPLGALGLLPFVDFAPKSGTAWLWLLSLAFVSTYLAYGVYYTGLREVEASRAVVVATVEPVVAALTGAALLGERLGPWGLAGGSLVLGAALAAGLGATRAARRSPGSPATPAASSG